MDMFLVLESNCRVLGLRNVACQKLALSDSPGRATLRIPKREDETLNHYEATLVPVSDDEADSMKAEENSVELQSVDSFLESRGVDRVDLIKRDLKGYEIVVLRGVEQLIRKCHPAILSRSTNLPKMELMGPR